MKANAKCAEPNVTCIGAIVAQLLCAIMVPSRFDREHMKNFTALLLASFLVLGCKVSSKSQVESTDGEFSSRDEDVDRIPEVMKGHGISLPSLSLMEDSPEDQTSLSYQNALVSAWLSGLVYGSATQIATQLMQAGIIDGKVAERAIQKANLIQLFRVLGDSFAGNGKLSAGEYMRQATAMARVDFGIKALPTLYGLVVNDFGTPLDSDLLTELGKARDGREVNRIVGAEARFYLDLLRSKDPEAFAKNQKIRSVSSERLELVFRGLTSVLIHKGRQSIPLKAANEELDPFFQKVRERISDDPLAASKSFSGIAELLEYQLANEESKEVPEAIPFSRTEFAAAASPSPSRLLLFSGGRLQASKSDLFQEGSTQLLVIEHRNNRDVFFVFRGTKGYKDWFLNLHPGLDVDPIDGQGRVHQGFVKAFSELTLPRIPVEFDDQSVTPEGQSKVELALEIQNKQQKYSVFRPVLLDVLNRAQRNQKRIWVAGHSLGGAMGLLFLKKLLVFPEYRDLVAGAYTIGAPRIGDDTFAKNFDLMKRSMLSRIVRLRYEKDLVALLNPRNQFAQDSQLVQLTKKGSCFIQDRLLQLFKMNQSGWFHKNMANCTWSSGSEETFPEVADIDSTGKLTESIADHSFFNYIETLST